MAQDWYIRSGSGESGPFSSAQLKRFAEEGRLSEGMLVRKAQSRNWVPAGDIPGLIPESFAPRQPAASLPPSSRRSSGSGVNSRRRGSSQGRSKSSGGISQGLWLAIGGGAIGVVLLIVVILVATGGSKEPSGNNFANTNSPAASNTTASTVADGTGTTPAQSLNPQPQPVAPPEPPKPLTTEEVVARTEASIALIKGRNSSGTGFLVRPGIVATNRHVIEGELAEHIKIHFPSAAEGQKGPWDAMLMFKDPVRDLAFLQIKSTLPPLTVARNHSFRRGQEVIVIGNPGVGDELVLQNAVSRGVLSTEAKIEGQDYYQLGISINSGNSGGPVLDQMGEVIGVVTLKATEQEGLGFCIPVTLFNDTMKSVDTLTPREIARTTAQHRMETVFRVVRVTGELYKSGMRIYTRAMEQAISRGQSVNLGLQRARSEIEVQLSAYNDFLLGDLEGEVTRVSQDFALSDETRQRFADLWSNYKELKSYVDNPRGNLNSYKAKLNELSDNHDRLSRSLALLLGVKDDDDF